MAENITKSEPLDFIREIISNDVKNGKHGGTVLTRFPPDLGTRSIKRCSASRQRRLSAKILAAAK